MQSWHDHDNEANAIWTNRLSNWSEASGHLMFIALSAKHFCLRCQKIRKNLEKRKRKPKLTVLREFAHDPLTSNDEGEKNPPQKKEEASLWGYPDLEQCKLDEKMIENLAINGEQDVLGFESN